MVDLELLVPTNRISGLINTLRHNIPANLFKILFPTIFGKLGAFFRAGLGLGGATFGLEGVFLSVPLFGGGGGFDSSYGRTISNRNRGI